MMRFNCSRMESLVEGTPCAARPGFSAQVSARGSFMARVKRTGRRTKQLGWVSLLLLEGDRLAVCADFDESDGGSSGTDSDVERVLVFPVLTGSEFAYVKRHGSTLTLHATRVSLTLETEGGAVDDEASLAAGQWTRILQRIAGSAPQGNTGEAKMFEGLGISVPNAMSTVSHAQGAGRQHTKPKSLVPISTQRSASNLSLGSMIPPQQAAPLFIADHTTVGGVSAQPAMSTSQSLKRISLGLSSMADFGFGEDLKAVLSTLDENARPETIDSATENSKTTAEEELDGGLVSEENKENSIAGPAVNGQPREFELPSAPFNQALSSSQNSTPHSESSTPSPSQMYLHADSSTRSLKRVESIMVKEQQQHVERYGPRAATMSSFSGAPARTDSPQGSRQPPSIPAPTVKEQEPAAKRAKNVDKSQTETAEDKKAVRMAKTVSISMQAPTVHIISPQAGFEDDVSDEGAEDAVEEADKPSEESGLPSPRQSPKQSDSAKLRKKSTIVGKVKRLWTRKRKETQREFKGPAELRREAEAAERSQFDLKEREKSATENTANTSSLPPVTDSPPPAMARKSLRRVEEIQEEPEASIDDENEDATSIPPNTIPPQIPATIDSPPEIGDEPVQATAATSTSHGPTAAVPKLDSSHSISALSFRSLSSRSLSSRSMTPGDATDNSVLSVTPAKAASAQARLDPKQDASWRVGMAVSAPQSSSSRSYSTYDGAQPDLAGPMRITESNSISSLQKPPSSLDPGPMELTDRTTNPVIRRLFETNRSTPALNEMSMAKENAGMPGKHSAQSSYSSFASSKRSLSSAYGGGSQYSSQSSLSSAVLPYSSSASSFSTPALTKQPNPLEMTMFSSHLWVSKWTTNKWTPLSQLELKTEIVASEGQTRVLVTNPGGVGCISLKVQPQREPRKVSAHDVEFMTAEDTYMFRGRDAENSQKFYRTLQALQSKGNNAPVTAALNATIGDSRMGFDSDLDVASRRRTLMPPTLSRSNQNLKYMGMSTSTIVEE